MARKQPVIKEGLVPVLHVANAGTAIAWYQRLGFTVEFEHSSGPAFEHTTAGLKRGELGLILSARDKRDMSDGIVYLQVADVVPIAAEFDVPLQNSLMGSHIELKDPDGNIIRVVSAPRVSFPPRVSRFKYSR